MKKPKAKKKSVPKKAPRKEVSQKARSIVQQVKGARPKQLKLPKSGIFPTGF